LLIVVGCSEAVDPERAFAEGDYETSYRLWKVLAEQGDAAAQNYVGIHYYLGLGVDRDYHQALEWYERAARAGHPDAQRNTGVMYHYGRGVPRDYYTAYIWYFAAAQQGSEKAKIHLAILAADKLSPNQQMHAKLEANRFIRDPSLRFMSHDTYVDNSAKRGSE